MQKHVIKISCTLYKTQAKRWPGGEEQFTETQVLEVPYCQGGT